VVRPSTNASSIYRRLSQFLWLHFKHLQFASFFFTLRTVAYTQYANQAFIAYFAAHLHSAHPHITTHIHTLLSKSWQFAVSLHILKNIHFLRVRGIFHEFPPPHMMIDRISTRLSPYHPFAEHRSSLACDGCHLLAATA